MVKLFLGQRAWVLQRLSAVVALLLLAVGGMAAAFAAPITFDRWRGIASSAHGAVLIVVFFVALGLHAWIGVRDIVLDYVHPRGLRLALLALTATILTGVVIRVVLLMAAQFRIGG